MLRAGVMPGTTDEQTIRLGYHLAGCPACREVQQHLQTELLDRLLAQPLQSGRLLRLRRYRRPFVQLLAVALVAWFGFQSGRVTMAALTIQSNLSFMQLRPTTTAAGSLQPAPTLAAFVVPTARSLAVPPAPTLPLPTDLPEPTATPVVPAGDALHILLLGSDRRPGEGWATRSDAVVLLRLEPQRGRVALLSLPRDLVVPIPGYGSARINSATAYGELYPELGGGAELARTTVSQLLGLPVQYVVWADFNGFIAAIDAVGGVDVDVPAELYDPRYPTMDYGYMEVYIAAGPQHFDGERALIYSRIRHSDSAFARDGRQQQVLIALARRLLDQSPVRQAELAAEVTTALREHIRTDLNSDELIGLAWAMRSTDPSVVERYALGGNAVIEGLIPGDPYAMTADAAALRALVAAFVGSQ
jgi:polyisoprenyl-teichoic acid--peptidoglycan teichoic acid transferase